MCNCEVPACSLDLKDIKVVTKLGGTVDDSEQVEGMVFDHKAAKSAGGPTRMENARIGLIQFQISPPKTDLENNVSPAACTWPHMLRHTCCSQAPHTVTGASPACAAQVGPVQP